MNKAQLRHKLRELLSNKNAEKRTRQSRQTCANLIVTKEFQAAQTIMMYLALPTEVDLTEALVYCWKNDKTVLVPKVHWDKKHMVAVQINSLEEEFDTVVKNLRNPRNDKHFEHGQIDLVLAPGLGFDRKGNRLGRGGGYYDKFFADFAKHEKTEFARCGICFHEQLIDVMPITDYDEHVDFLVTDREVIYFSSGDSGRCKGG